jgi:hypothetical protein
MQPCRGRINVVNLQNKNDGGCFGDLRAMHQRIDIISLLYFFLAGYGGAAADRDGNPKKVSDLFTLTAPCQWQATVFKRASGAGLKVARSPVKAKRR